MGGFGGLNSNLISTTGIMHDHAPKTIYWKGGSKDIRDVTAWEWKHGGVPGTRMRFCMLMQQLITSRVSW